MFHRSLFMILVASLAESHRITSQLPTSSFLSTSIANHNRKILSAQSEESSSAVITFHLLPHSHCDAGYKKTWTEYYQTEVKQVLTSVTEYLMRDESHKTRFVWSELIFLEHWFQDPSIASSIKDSFRTLVMDQQRIEFVNGGFVMHDEAITRYESWIAQTTLGHDLIRQLFFNAKKNFIRPKIQSGYQIDPFGLSSFTPTFLSNAGYTFLIGNRIPQAIKDVMKETQGLEFWWNPFELADSTLKERDRLETNILVHIYDDHYETPCCGFDWEDHKSSREQTPWITPDNVQQRADIFVDLLMKRRQYYSTTHILIPFGQDFRFQNASLQFDNMNQIISFVKDNTHRYFQMYQHKIVLRYSTVSEYLDQLRLNTQNGKDLPVRYGSHFLPHVSRDKEQIACWSGYYSQYTNLKQAVRIAELLLHISDISAPFYSPSRGCRSISENLWSTIQSMHQQARRIVMMMQHHDALPSTAYHHVIYDYMAQIHEAIDSLISVISIYVYLFVTEDQKLNESSILPLLISHKALLAGGSPYVASTSVIAGNVGSDPTRVIRVEMGRPVIVHLLNSQSYHVREQVIHLYVSRSDIRVRDQSNEIILSQVRQLRKYGMVELFQLSFFVHNIHGFGITSISLETCYVTSTTDDFPPRGDGCAILTQQVTKAELYHPDGLGGNHVHVTFDENTGDISGLILKGEKEETRFVISHSLWIFDGSSDNVYLLDNSGDVPPRQLYPLGGDDTMAEIGPIYSVITVPFQDGHSLIYQVTNYLEPPATVEAFVHIEIHTSVLHKSTNLMSRFKSSVGVEVTDLHLHTIENGFQHNKHTINKTLSLGENLHPLTSWAWIEGDKCRFAVYSVDPRGVTLFDDQSLGITWHRRNGDPAIDLKSGDDGSKVRSSIWLGLQSLGDYFPPPSELAAMVILNSDVVTRLSRSMTFRDEELTVTDGQMTIPFLSKENGIVRIVFQGSGSLNIDSLFNDGISLVELKSLTFYGSNTSPACSINVVAGHRFLDITPRSLCALELVLQRRRHWYNKKINVFCQGCFEDSERCVLSSTASMQIFLFGVILLFVTTKIILPLRYKNENKFAALGQAVKNPETAELL